MAGQLDLFVPGVVYLDVIFTGLRELPGPGTEVWAPGMGSCPGGVANLAVAASRLGLHTGLGTALSSDAYGEFCHQVLSRQEGIDLSASLRVDDWHSPVTVSLAYDRDRSMITHGHPLPTDDDGLVNGLPPARAAAVSLAGTGTGWVHRAAAAGTRVFADVGWDETDQWSCDVLAALEDCHAFLPNAVEAMRYTRTDSPRQALDKLSGLVPVVVVTCGAEGALAVDSSTGEVASVPAVPVEALDPTGAGDVFTAGFITGTLGGWPLADRVAFANLVASLSVQHFGGSLSAPGWGDIADWWQAVRQGHQPARTSPPLAEPGTRPAQPDPRAERPGAGPEQPGLQAARPGGRPARPHAEGAQPRKRAARPGAEAAQLGDQAARSGDGAARPGDQTVRLGDQTVRLDDQAVPHHDPELVRRYSFLDDVIPPGRRNAVHRATATIARLSDVR